MDWTWYLFRFDGRINRALLWQALLIVSVLACMLGMIDQAIKVLNGSTTFAFNFKVDLDFGVDDIFNVVDPRAYRLPASAGRARLILKVLGTSLFLWIYLATAIKRLHDRDRSGWWIVPFFFVPTLFDQFSDLLPTESNWVLALAWTMHIPWFWGLVEMFIVPGTSGNNRFGPDPLAQDEDSSASSLRSVQGWDQQSEIEFVPPSASPPGGMHVKRGG
jgi:uncharacterized membrane protein YhaH (DUF805 family)